MQSQLSGDWSPKSQICFPEKCGKDLDHILGNKTWTNKRIEFPCLRCDLGVQERWVCQEITGQSGQGWRNAELAQGYWCWQVVFYICAVVGPFDPWMLAGQRTGPRLLAFHY